MRYSLHERGPKAAIELSAHICHKGDAKAITALAARLKDSAWNVREAAVEVLARIVQAGDANAIAAVTARLEDSDLPKFAHI